MFGDIPSGMILELNKFNVFVPVILCFLSYLFEQLQLSCNKSQMGLCINYICEDKDTIFVVIHEGFH